MSRSCRHPQGGPDGRIEHMGGVAACLRQYCASEAGWNFDVLAEVANSTGHASR